MSVAKARCWVRSAQDGEVEGMGWGDDRRQSAHRFGNTGKSAFVTGPFPTDAESQARAPPPGKCKERICRALGDRVHREIGASDRRDRRNLTTKREAHETWKANQWSVVESAM